MFVITNFFSFRFFRCAATNEINEREKNSIHNAYKHTEKKTPNIKLIQKFITFHYIYDTYLFFEMCSRTNAHSNRFPYISVAFIYTLCHFVGNMYVFFSLYFCRFSFDALFARNSAHSAAFYFFCCRFGVIIICYCSQHNIWFFISLVFWILCHPIWNNAIT